MQHTNSPKSRGWLDQDSRWFIGLCVAQVASTLPFNVRSVKGCGTGVISLIVFGLVLGGL